MHKSTKWEVVPKKNVTFEKKIESLETELSTIRSNSDEEKKLFANVLIKIGNSIIQGE